MIIIIDHNCSYFDEEPRICGKRLILTSRAHVRAHHFYSVVPLFCVPRFTSIHTLSLSCSFQVCFQNLFTHFFLLVSPASLHSLSEVSVQLGNYLDMNSKLLVHQGGQTNSSFLSGVQIAHSACTNRLHLDMN